MHDLSSYQYPSKLLFIIRSGYNSIPQGERREGQRRLEQPPHNQPQRAKARIKIGPGEEPDTGPKTGRDPKAGPEPPNTTQTGKTTREGKHHTDIEDN